MKTAALHLPAANPSVEPFESHVGRLIASLQRSLRDVAGAPMELSETERIVRNAEALRAAFLGASARDR
jgi:hypothetical protein